MKNLAVFLITIAFLFSCREKPSGNSSDKTSVAGTSVLVKYATGFDLVQYDDFSLLTVHNPWPGADTDFTYLLAEKNADIPKALKYNHKITVPVQKIVVTSTTHIPSLETLEEEQTLVGFPRPDYISSPKTRALINAGKVQNIGANQSLNTEKLLALRPDVIIGFAVNGDNKAYNLIQKNGIPVVFNADWVEKHPLGKAEWIKFFGAFYHKIPQATEAFQQIEKDYQAAKKLARTATEKPLVISGAMYKDRWYLPYGNSWQAQFIKDAYGKYIYADRQGNGSIALAFEKVWQDAKNADIWIAPGTFTRYEEMLKNSNHYRQFEAFRKKKIYNYAGVTGETGGVLYYELAPNRPDLVLKDLIKIFHPGLLPEYETTFFKPLK